MPLLVSDLDVISLPFNGPGGRELIPVDRVEGGHYLIQFKVLVLCSDTLLAILGL